MRRRAASVLGSARFQRAGFGILPKRTFLRSVAASLANDLRKVRDGRMPSPARYKRALPRAAATLLMLAALSLAACRRGMVDQQRLKPLAEENFFADGRGSRVPPRAHRCARANCAKTNNSTPAKSATNSPRPFRNRSRGRLLERGRERFEIYCAVCHGRTGEGNGMIVQRGFPQPPSLHEQSLRDAPVGHFFDVITNGYGVMYPYASRVAPEDRWAMAAYIRALQLSQHAAPADADAASHGGPQRMNEAAEIGRWKTRASFVGAVAAILSLLGAFVYRAQFFHSYLFAWLFWSGLSFGALVIVMMQFLTGGLWGLALRNFALAAIGALPLMALLFLPVLLGAHDIYPWTRGLLAEAGGYHHKAQWLNLPFFTARSIFYFAILIILALLVRRWSLAQSNPRNVPPRLSALSAIGLIAYVLCMNFASTDWVMSLDPQWYSTIFVVIFMAGTFPRPRSLF